MGGQIKSFTIQPKYELHGRDGSVVCRHYPDFLVVTLADGEEVRETKSIGSVTQEWKLKKKLFEAEYDIPYKVIWKTK